MKCPIDSATLVMSERNGIEIDYCPDCRGVWLDRGELDKIIDRAGSSAPASASPREPSYPDPQFRPSSYPQGSEHQGYQRPYKKKRENWLSELFD